MGKLTDILKAGEKPRLSYREQLQLPGWQRRRLKEFERAEWYCESCGESRKRLEIHHLEYGEHGEPPESVQDGWLEVLCRDCHEWREHWNSLFGRCFTKTRTLRQNKDFIGLVAKGEIELGSPAVNLAFAFSSNEIMSQRTVDWLRRILEKAEKILGEDQELERYFAELKAKREAQPLCVDDVCTSHQS